MTDKKQYFATLPVDELGDALIKKKDSFYNYMEASGQFALLRNVYDLYHQPAMQQGKILISGDQGQLLNISVNHMRSIVQRQVSFITSDRPHFEPKAANTDTKSMLQAQLASSILEYYNRVKKMERFSRKAVESAILYGEAFVSVTWNHNMGNEITKDLEGNSVREGDIEFKNYLGIDVIRDLMSRNPEDVQWVILRERKNKFDLIAAYPEKEEEILASCDQEQSTQRWTLNYNDHRPDITQDSDIIEVYHFYHKPSEIMPQGRYVEFTSSDMVIDHGPLPYPQIPVYRVAPGEHTDLITGYTTTFDLLPLQHALNKLHSTIVTNQAAFGVQNIALPKGSDLNSIELGGNLRIIEFDQKTGPPVPLQLLSTSPEIFNYAQQVVRDMETLSGVNAVARGQTSSEMRSAAAIALIHDQAVQASQVMEQSYIQLLEDLGTGIIDLLKAFALEPRLAMISGKANAHKLAEFKGEDLNGITRVYVDIGNPMTRTNAGKQNIAELMVQQGIVKNPMQIWEVLTTGRLEPVYESELASLNLIRRENEHLAEGKSVPVIRLDDHVMHIQEHQNVLSTPESREDVARIEVVLAHIAEHEAELLAIQAAGGMLATPPQAEAGMQPQQQPQPQNPEQEEPVE